MCRAFLHLKGCELHSTIGSTTVYNTLMLTIIRAKPLFSSCPCHIHRVRRCLSSGTSRIRIGFVQQQADPMFFVHVIDRQYVVHAAQGFHFFRRRLDLDERQQRLTLAPQKMGGTFMNRQNHFRFSAWRRDPAGSHTHASQPFSRYRYSLFLWSISCAIADCFFASAKAAWASLSHSGQQSAKSSTPRQGRMVLLSLRMSR